MDARFAALVDNMHVSVERLLAVQPVTMAQFPKEVPERGIYLFTEPGTGHLYVGRSNRIRKRYDRHCRAGSTIRMAAFAFRLAREATGYLKPSYKPGTESRKGLIAKPDFHAAFTAAKARIRQMEFRYVEETDPVRQCLLEVYAAVALQTPYNDFDTH